MTKADLINLEFAERNPPQESSAGQKHKPASDISFPPTDENSGQQPHKLVYIENTNRNTNAAAISRKYNRNISELLMQKYAIHDFRYL